MCSFMSQGYVKWPSDVPWTTQGLDLNENQGKKGGNDEGLLNPAPKLKIL